MARHNFVPYIRSTPNAGTILNFELAITERAAYPLMGSASFSPFELARLPFSMLIHRCFGLPSLRAA
jgi:hypothetical protein